MMKKILLIFILISVLGSLFGQDSLKYRSRIHLKTTLGADIPISKLYNDDITDNLWYGKHSFSWQIYSISFFINDYWGIENSLHLLFTNDNQKRPKQMREYFSLNYPNHYLYTTMYDNFSSTHGRCLISLIYRYETTRFYIYPRFMTGIYFMRFSSESYYLKGLNPDDFLKISYKPEKTNPTYGIVGLSASIGYKLSKRFYLNLDIPFFYTRVNTKYTKTITDMDSNTVLEEETAGRKKNLFSFNPSLGFIIVLKHSRNL